MKTSRDGFLVDTDLDRLRARIADYFDPGLSDEDIARRYPAVMKTTARFDARAVRDALLKRGGPDEAGFIRFAYRPFDNRWLYWEKDTKLLDEKRADYRPHVFEGNLWLGSSKREIQADFTHGTWIHDLANWKYGFWGVHVFPAWLLRDGLDSNGDRPTPRKSLGDRATLSRPPWPRCGRSVPPCPYRHARSRLPRRQCWRLPYGMAPNPATQVGPTVTPTARKRRSCGR